MGQEEPTSCGPVLLSEYLPPGAPREMFHNMSAAVTPEGGYGPEAQSTCSDRGLGRALGA